jgi:AAA family ATP:ADP antiporter
MVPAQFWSFANDLYTPEAGKRLFVLLAFGASMGAVVGSDLSSRLIEPLGVAQLLLVAAFVLLSSLWITLHVESRPGKQSAQAAKEQPLGRDGAFELVLRKPYLLRIALLLLLSNWVNTTGEYVLSRTVRADAERSAIEQSLSGPERDEFVGTEVGKFYAGFFRGVNILGLALQLFVVSRILRRFGVRTALFVLPLIALGGYAAIALGAASMLALVRWVKTVENGTDYSLQNTVRQALFLPTTREEKYKAKQAIDTFFVRAGDVLSALLVYVGTTWLAFGTKSFAVASVLLVSIWLVLAAQLGRDFVRLNPEDERPAAT